MELGAEGRLWVTWPRRSEKGLQGKHPDPRPCGVVEGLVGVGTGNTVLWRKKRWRRAKEEESEKGRRSSGDWPAFLDVCSLSSVSP